LERNRGGEMRYEIRQDYDDADKCVIDMDMDIGGLEAGSPFGTLPCDTYKLIKEVKGVISFSVENRYRISLKKGALFSWDDILLEVVVILRDAFAPGEEIYIEGSD